MTNSWTYDERGQVSSATVNAGTGYTTSWTYNNADMLASMTYPDGEIVKLAYNSRMLLDQVKDDPASPGPITTYVSSTGYDSTSRITGRALGNGLTQQFTYYQWDEQVNNVPQMGRLETILTGTLQDLNYTYDKVGNVTQIRDDIASETSDYTYDTLSRLKSWTLTGNAPETYTYDPNSGNLATKGSLSLTYGAQGLGAPAPSGCINEATGPRNIAHAVSNAGGNSYQYDCDGNMKTRVIGGQTFNLGYDDENRLVSVSGPGVSASFVYDGDGNRVQSTIGGVTTTFVGNYYEVSSAPVSGVTKYYYAGASRVAMNVNGTVSYLLSDQLGSTSITADGNGNKLTELRYKAWGEIRYTSGTPTNYQYTGQYAYASLGLDYYVARFYDPALGRFISADTIVPDGVQGYDRYAYANNNPVLYNDPSGHSSCVGAFADDGPECAKKEGSQLNQEIKQKEYQDKCSEGALQGCQGGTKGMLAWGAAGVLTAGTAEYALTGGAVADAGWAAMWKAGGACIQSAVCRILTGMAGGAAAADAASNSTSIPASDLYYSQKGVSWATKGGIPLDDLSQDMAQGWQGDPLRVVNIGDQLVSLDNRRLVVAKLLDISVPVTTQDLSSAADLLRIGRDGIFDQISIRGTGMIVDMFGNLR